jgi:hypothetical protein
VFEELGTGMNDIIEANGKHFGTRAGLAIYSEPSDQPRLLPAVRASVCYF